MEKDLGELNNSALVGVLFGSHLVYNVLDFDTCFQLTGLSIIHYLKTNKNKFISEIILSQSYNGIKYIMDDKIVFNDFYHNNEQNLENFNKFSKKILSDFEDIYIYDVVNDLLLIKDGNELIALEYNDSKNVRNYLNSKML